MSGDSDHRDSCSGLGGAATPAVDPSFAPDMDDDLLHEIVVDSASECFVVVDERNRMVFANQVVEELFGYEPSEIVGEHLTTIIPPEYREAHLTGFSEYLRTGERTVDWNDLEFLGLHRDGTTVPLLITFREFTRGHDHYFVGVMRDNSRRIEQRERLASEKAYVESMLDALPDVVYAFDQRGEFLRWNERANEVTGYTDEEIASMEPLDFIPERDHERVARSLNRVMTNGAVETIESALVTKDGTEIAYEFTGAPLIEDGEIIGETGVGRDITERKRRKEQLRRLDDLNTVIRSVDRAIIEASRREEIERAVCEQLVAEGGYVGAVTGDVDESDGALTVTASSGLDPGAFESAVTDPHGDSGSLWSRALGTRSVAVASGHRENGTDPWRRDAREQEYDAVAAVPITYEGREFGVLAVCADEREAFRSRERTILAELGEVVANAIKGALAHQLLYANTVTEVELRTTDRDVGLVALSAEADCRLRLTRALSYGDDAVLFLTVTGADPEDVLDVVESAEEFESVEYFGTHGDEHRFQFVTDRGTIAAELSKYGAKAVAGEAESGVGHLTVQLPSGVDVRTFVDGIESAFPETELVGRQEVERALQTPSAFRQDLAAEMTEKQRAALEAAYFAGYFEWPSRTNSAREVAEMLDIAPQTFHQHLRVALAKLLTTLFREHVNDDVE